MTSVRDIQRFTLDGSDDLEARLAEICNEALAGIRKLVPAHQLDAVVLAGGYGRGQGGVLRTPAGDRPYNDFDFYVFVRGHLLFDSGRWSQKLNELGEQLSPTAGLHVEFKLDSLAALRRRPASMFSYDLVAAHRLLHGADDLFRGCEHHLDASRLPLSEATRLLFNRCSGLLLAKRLIGKQSLTPADTDFVGRNLAKAQLALGDALLAAAGRYHWDCLERHQRLVDTSFQNGPLPLLESIREHHAVGIEFKLHPYSSSEPAALLAKQHRDVSSLASQLWLWLESRRLGSTFESLRDYAVSPADKCPESSLFKDLVLNLKALGPGALVDGAGLRYPRNRLLNSLPLLLWNGELAKEPELLRHVQKQLHTRATEWPELVTAYQRIWSHHG